MIAWISYLAMSAITIFWALDVGQGLGTGLALTDRNAGVLLIGSLFGAAIGRLALRIRKLAEIETRRAAAISAEEISVAQRGVRLDRLEQMALPFLRRVAEGVGPESLRAEAVVLEGQLRDQVRAGVLASALADAVSQARARGVEVTLLDDLRDAPPDEVMDQLVRFVDDRLRGMTDGKLVVRLLPPGSGRLRDRARLPPGRAQRPPRLPAHPTNPIRWLSRALRARVEARPPRKTAPPTTHSGG